MCSDISAELLVSSSKKIGVLFLFLFSVYVYGAYRQLTLEKTHTSRFVFVEKREVFTEIIASFSQERNQ